MTPPAGCLRADPRSAQLNGKIAEISLSEPQVGGRGRLTNNLLLLLLLPPSVVTTPDNLNYSSGEGQAGVIRVFLW